MKKIILIIGGSCSGKDTLMNELLKDSKYKRVVSCTTRQKRPAEVGGVNYHYIDNSVFVHKQLNKEFVAHVEYLGNNYGVSIDEFVEDKINVFVVDPIGAQQIINHFQPLNWNIKAVWLNLNLVDRLKFASMRGDTPTERVVNCEINQQMRKAQFPHYVIVGTNLQQNVEDVKGLF